MKTGTSIEQWIKSRQWDKRVKAVCKPCWELKYCPYGCLVEDFPYIKQDDDKRCRIFGHECPVFSVAEPFTETKELRNISREIPRPTQFRVLKRENQICSECCKPVRDEEIEFDHIIPYSKGGSSDENNVRLLCRNCNRKKGKRFEEVYLVNDHFDRLRAPDTETLIELLLETTSFENDFRVEHNRNLTAADLAERFSGEEVTQFEHFLIGILKQLQEFFMNRKPREISKKQFDALKLRWGFKDGFVYKMGEAAKAVELVPDEYFAAEQNLIRRLGINMSTEKSVISKWKKL